jgi:hypothetical protein
LTRGFVEIFVSDTFECAGGAQLRRDGGSLLLSPWIDPAGNQGSSIVATFARFLQ